VNENLAHAPGADVYDHGIMREVIVNRKTLITGSLLMAALLFSFSGCGGGGSDGGTGASQISGVSFASQVQTIFSLRCTGCHIAGGESAFLPLDASVSYGNIVNQPATQSSGTLVIPGNSSESVLFLRVSGSSLGTMMPKGQVPLSQEDQETIRVWIDEGALNN